MADQRIERLARLAVRYSVNTKKGDEVVIVSGVEGAPLVRELYREALEAGAYPMVMAGFDFTNDLFFKHATDDQLQHVSPFRKFMYEKVDSLISVAIDTNTRSMSNVPPERMRQMSVSRTEIMKIFNERTKKGELKWVAVPFPCNALAQEGNMSLIDYEDFVYSSCLADRPDPIKEWQKVAKFQDKIIARLKGVSELRFLGQDTDISMSIQGRRWENCKGDKNLPDGEVFTAPVEDSVDGEIRFTYPGIFMGREIEDIRLTFRKGKVVKAQAAKGEELLRELLKADAGACRLGEVAIGTNPGITRFTNNMLFDEKMGGTIHMALGNGYPETGAKNFSVIHWDILKDMRRNGRIYADGDLIYENGKFTA
jgi:aminopeptidase